MFSSTRPSSTTPTASTSGPYVIVLGTNSQLTGGTWPWQDFNGPPSRSDIEEIFLVLPAPRAHTHPHEHPVPMRAREAMNALEELLLLRREGERRHARDSFQEEMRELIRLMEQEAAPARVFGNHTLWPTMLACKRRSTGWALPKAPTVARVGAARASARGGTRGSRRSRVHRGFVRAMGRKRR